MTRLPTVNGDSGTWGTVLNDYLTQNVTSHYTLSSGTTAGATTLTLDKNAAGMLVGGTFVAVGAMTTKCEVRRVTAVSSATLTFTLSLKHAHSAGEFVWVLSDTWVPPEWFGCKANDSTFDNSTGMQQAFNDIALSNGIGYGITGRASRYYCATPLCIYDQTKIDQLGLIVKTPFSLDTTIGLCDSRPGTFFVTLGGQFVTVSSVDTSANTITLSGSIGTALGERMTFYPLQGSTLPAPLEAGRAYYLKTNPSGNTYTISFDRDGTTLDITSAGSGTTYVYSPGGARMRWDSLTLEGAALQGLNGLIAYTQQPSVARNLRIEAFPGGFGLACLGGQQGDYYTALFLDGHIGINFQGAQFLYFYGTSIEDCDRLLYHDSVDMQGGTTVISNKGNYFFASHWEESGRYTNLYQTIVGSALVSAGTFTLTFSGQTTSAIAYNANAATIQTALEALSNIAPGDVTCTDLAGGLPSGRCQILFSGAYAWSVVPITTITTAGLTGGVYTMNQMRPDATAISVGRQATSGLQITGAIASMGGTRPDGTGVDFFTLESHGGTTDGYLLENIVSTGQAGYAVNDIPRAIQVPWGDSSLVAGGCSERLMYFSAGGRHAAVGAKNWYLAGRTGGHVAWEEYAEQLQIEPPASLVLGNGTPLKAITTGATSVADGGTITHSLGTTPNVVNVTPSISGEFVSVTALGATTFTVAIKKHDGTAGTTQTLYWEAKDI